MKRFIYSIILSVVIVTYGCQPSPPPVVPPPEIPDEPATPSPPPIPSPTLMPAPSPTIGPILSFNPPAGLDMSVVVHSDRDGDNEIYTLDCSTGEISQLTDNEASDCYPSWSPDRESIVFVSDRDGNQEIYIMAAVGGDAERLTDNRAPDTFPAWSPAGHTIAFFSGGEAGDNLWIADLDAGHRRQLTSFEDGTGGTIAFSPDGNKIFFGYERMGKYKIYVLELSGAPPREIISRARKASRLSCIADSEGTALLYVTGKGNQEDIWLSFVDDGRFQHITKNTASDSSPSLSADREEVVFASQRNGDNWQLYTVSRKGKPTRNEVRRITNDLFNYYYPDVK